MTPASSKTDYLLRAGAILLGPPLIALAIGGLGFWFYLRPKRDPQRQGGFE